MNAILKQAIPYLVAVGALVFTKCQYDWSQLALGAAIERNAYLSDSLSVLKVRGQRIDSVFVRDTLRLTRLLQRTDTVIRQLFKTDTVTLTKRESVLVFVADSLVTSCRETVSSCSALVGNLREQLSLTSAQRDLWHRKAQPSLWEQLKQIPQKAITSTALMSVGYAACVVSR